MAEDYRTNRADFLIAKRANLPKGDLPTKKRAGRRDVRTARLTESPVQSATMDPRRNHRDARRQETTPPPSLVAKAKA